LHITRIYIHNEYADIKLEEVEIIGKEDTGNANTKLLTEFKQTPEEVDKYLQFSYCIKCGLCYSACPTTGADLKFRGPQALAQMYRYVRLGHNSMFSFCQLLLII
jgi:succinate dehydrogenase / fumarate reductase iron-sulfur subunit